MSTLSITTIDPPKWLPSHPIECLRIIELPTCVICGQPTRFYCGGCRDTPAFCTSAHFVAYWPMHSQTCDRNAALFAETPSDLNTAPSHPYSGLVSLRARSAIQSPLPSPGFPSSRHVSATQPYDRNVLALYAKYDGLACRFLTVNLSPNPVAGSTTVSLLDCFSRNANVKSFVIRRGVTLGTLDSPFHVFYCSDSYEGRYNPNRALARLTSTLSILSRRPCQWYGTVLVFKFRSDACQQYIDMTVDDVLLVRDYFAYYA
uniref:Zinc finger transcription factor 1 n=1 Tax=Ganoderma boninense TaxID=34458 RepID=A0A5K1K2N6_9APHY|nr:Zinc finger transcription factor 1 [Ganoderma boninense]